MRKKKYEILITGATGFVGRRLVTKLLKKYDRKKILFIVNPKQTTLETSGREILNRNKANILNGDLTVKEDLQKAPIKPKLIIHLAAQTDTAVGDHRVNYGGVKNLYRKVGPLNERSHFIHMGTMVNVVGRNNCLTPIDEKTRDYPTNEYTRTKLAAEKYLIRKAKKDNFRLTILRPNTIYGSNVRPNSMFDMLNNFINNDSLITRLNWPGKSALIHVDDVVKAIIFATNAPPKAGHPEKYLLYSENLSISNISRLMHKAKRKKYREIRLPGVFWWLAKKSRNMIPTFEPILPSNVYNYFWRLTIIVDDVVWSDSQKMHDAFPTWKPSKLESKINDVLN